MQPAVTAVVVGSGVALLAIGYAIRYGDTYRRLVAEEAEFVGDPEALTDFVGRWTIVVGALVAALGVAPDPLRAGAFLPVALLVIGALSLYVFVGAWRIARTPE